MQVEYKAWKAAEAKITTARAEEREAYAAFRKNLNKQAEWVSAKWGVKIAEANAEKAFEAYLNA
jgi:hypothetical protein